MAKRSQLISTSGGAHHDALLKPCSGFGLSRLILSIPMLRVGLLLILLSATVYLIPSNAHAQLAGAQAHDQTGRVYEGLTNLVVLRDLVSRRYALVVQGEWYETRGDGLPKLRPFYSIRLVDSRRDMNYYGHGSIGYTEPIGATSAAQQWTEILRCKGVVKTFQGTVTARGHEYVTKPNDISLKRFLGEQHFRGRYLDPFDDIIRNANFFESVEPTSLVVENVFLRGATFQSSQVVLNGDVESTWLWKVGDMDYKITLLQGAAYDYLPIEVKYFNQGKVWNSYTSHTRLNWRKENELWLPYQVEATEKTPLKPLRTVNYFMKFNWLVGDQADDELFDCDSHDHRVQVSKYFGVEFSQTIDGIFFRAPPWEPPADLYMRTSDKPSLR